MGKRSLRGGSWNNDSGNSTASNRNNNDPSNNNNNNGFRLAVLPAAQGAKGKLIEPFIHLLAATMPRRTARRAVWRW